MTEIKTKLKPFQKRPKDEPRPKTVHVVFWNGVHFSPLVKTTNERLEARLRDCLNDYAKGQRPGSMAAQFVAVSVAEGLSPSIFSIPEKSTGGTVAFMERREFWPMDGTELGGGVLLVQCETGIVEFWGGQGLHDDAYNPGIPGRKALLNLEVEDDGQAGDS